MKKQSFFQANKVLIIGLLTAIALAVNELVIKGESSTKVLIYAAGLAAASFLSNNLRGQWASIAGIFGTGLLTYITMEQNGHVSWLQLLGQAVVAFLAIVAPPAKSRGYEHSNPIEQAKSEGERLKPSSGSKSHK